MILWPILLSRKVLPGYMPIVGSNSLAISAACRVSPLAQVPRSDGDEIGEDTKQTAHKQVDHIPTDDTTRRDNELEELVPPAETSPEVEEGCSGVGDIALHPLKWGEVEMPEDWYTREGEDSDNVGHLSFDFRPPPRKCTPKSRILPASVIEAKVGDFTSDWVQNIDRYRGQPPALDAFFSIIVTNTTQSHKNNTDPNISTQPSTTKHTNHHPPRTNSITMPEVKCTKCGGAHYSSSCPVINHPGSPVRQ
ncbi:hypothetical protein CMUS01_15544 [Colletotrichum musicola]|uniref:Uncharacterized protein n=1 Tax=Colletotrichum musicola TaxID=2175873 RepID=A0A8H6MMQ3_9PEZI|nr:hypothetical protein CMUS01_15544 [Colletotrichum musicola]